MRARSIASTTLGWLQNPKPAQVLHVFEKACNLQAVDGEVFSLVTSHVGDGPFNIVLDPVNFCDYASGDTTVRIEEERIQVGELEITLIPAQVWEPRFAWESFRGKQDTLPIFGGMVEDVLAEIAPVESFVQLIHPRASAKREIEAQMLESAQAPAEILVKGLLSGEENLCRASARKLAGLGAGLTPDGDDFMMGCILALWAILAGEGVQEIASWVSLEAIPRTTPIAAAWLQAASRGACSVRWHELLLAMRLEYEEIIRSAARSIIHQGHTSGASALAGFTAILIGEMDRKRTSQT